VKIHNLNISEIINLVEIKELLIATGLCHQNGKMECWNVGSKGGN